MEIARTLNQLSQSLRQWKAQKLSYAFVPTMGALHEGHLSLVREALKHYPRVVVSVFVNPTQFDRPEDLNRYPRQPEKDAEMLAGAGAQLLFLPSVRQIYPKGTAVSRPIDLGELNTRYEGAARPGHFQGVVQVVRRLIELLKPEAMFMGQKDAQQVAVLRKAAQLENWPVNIIAVPTVREASGLAMSSRNGLLSQEAFAQAAVISQALFSAREAWNQGALPRELEARGRSIIEQAGLRCEYFDFIDQHSFRALDNLPATQQPQSVDPLIVTVAWLEGVRLIDNLPL